MRKLTIIALLFTGCKGNHIDPLAGGYIAALSCLIVLALYYGSTWAVIAANKFLTKNPKK